MRIPKRFRLLGHEWTVRVVPKKEWKDEECVGECSFMRREILILRGDRSLMEHTLIHEYLHAALEAMNNDLCENEAFVDPLAGLLHQILITAK